MTGILSAAGTRTCYGIHKPPEVFGLVNPPLPLSDNVGTSSYFVTQTINGCESAMAQIDVNIHPTPARPVVTSEIEYCLGDITDTLVAMGLLQTAVVY